MVSRLCGGWVRVNRNVELRSTIKLSINVKAGRPIYPSTDEDRRFRTESHLHPSTSLQKSCPASDRDNQQEQITPQSIIKEETRTHAPTHKDSNARRTSPLEVCIEFGKHPAVRNRLHACENLILEQQMDTL